MIPEPFFLVFQAMLRLVNITANLAVELFLEHGEFLSYSDSWQAGQCLDDGCCVGNTLIHVKKCRLLACTLAMQHGRQSVLPICHHCKCLQQLIEISS